MEGGGAVIWLYRLTTLYLSLWTQGPKKAEDRPSAKSNFTSQVEKCLESFIIIRNHTEPMLSQRSTDTLYFTIYKQTYCSRYTDSLQCLHEFLVREPSTEATALVQETLSQPWALHTNQLCDINVKKPPTKVTKQTIQAEQSQSVQQTSNMPSSEGLKTLQKQNIHTSPSPPNEGLKTLNKLSKEGKLEDINRSFHPQSIQQTDEHSSSVDDISINSKSVHEHTNSMDNTLNKNEKLLFATKRSQYLRDSVSDKNSGIVFKSVAKKVDNEKNMIVNKNVIQVFKIPTSEHSVE